MYSSDFLSGRGRGSCLKLEVCRPNFVGLAEDFIERRGDHVRERFA
jgi:hypothetical protein